MGVRDRVSCRGRRAEVDTNSAQQGVHLSGAGAWLSRRCAFDPPMKGEITAKVSSTTTGTKY
jgi:hypothetical protein